MSQAYGHDGLFCDTKRQSAGQGTLYFWVYVFYLSKFYELLDTVFIVLRKAPLRFLHFYHHSMTFFLCWVCLEYSIPVQWIATTLNAFVHIPMYDPCSDVLSHVPFYQISTCTGESPMNAAHIDLFFAPEGIGTISSLWSSLASTFGGKSTSPPSKSLNSSLSCSHILTLWATIISLFKIAALMTATATSSPVWSSGHICTSSLTSTVTLIRAASPALAMQWRTNQLRRKSSNAASLAIFLAVFTHFIISQFLVV